MMISRQNLDSKRDLTIIREPQKIKYLVKKHFLGLNMQLSGHEPPIAAKIMDLRDTSHIVVDFHNFYPEIGDNFTMYKVLARYVHLRGRVVQDQVEGGRYFLVLLNHIAIAKQQRRSLRIPIQGDMAFISNVRLSRKQIDVDMLRIPVSIKLGFEELKQGLSEQYPHAKVEVEIYSPRTKMRSYLLQRICQAGKPLLVSDCANTQSYIPFNKSYFDYAGFLGNKLQEEVQKMRQQAIYSQMCLPIIYLTHEKIAVTLGYAYLESKSRHFQASDVKELWHKIGKMIERVHEANTMFVAERQKIVDLSRDGLMFLTKNPILTENLSKQAGFSFDLVFQMQAPITLYALIRSVTKTRKGAMVGVQIEGNSFRPNEMKHFYENISQLEMQYKIAKQV